MEQFSAQREFSAYGPSHLAVLALFVVGAIALIWIGRKQTESQARLFGRVLAVLILAAFIVALVYKLIRPSMDTSVPLQLCDIAELAAAYALWSQRHWAFTLTYFWGLVLSSQSPPPSSSSSLFTWGLGMRPRWRSYRFAVVATLIWVAFTFTFNTLAGTNYGYLNRKPPPHRCWM